MGEVPIPGSTATERDGATVVVICAHELLGDGIAAYLSRAGVDVAVVAVESDGVQAVVGRRTRLVVLEHDGEAPVLPVPRSAAPPAVVDVSASMAPGTREVGGVDLDALLALARS